MTIIHPLGHTVQRYSDVLFANNTGDVNQQREGMSMTSPEARALMG